LESPLFYTKLSISYPHVLLATSTFYASRVLRPLDLNNPITDPRHIDYIPEPEEFHETEPTEEFLARGVYHVATLQGPQAQLSPTHLILPTIEQAAAQGEEIPVDIEPIASTSAVIIQNPVLPPPINIQPAMAQPEGAQIQGNIIGQQAQQQAQPAGGQQQAPAGQPIQINANRSLKGNTPTPFDGNRAKSAGFLLTFNLFRAANCHNDAMANPFSCITIALTYMTGDAIEAWKEDQLNVLMGRVNTGILETDEQLWDLFEADFQ
jgi:hypothetical protein